MSVSLGGVCIVDSSVSLAEVSDHAVRDWLEKTRPEPGQLLVVESLPHFVLSYFDSRAEGLTIGGGAANAAWRLSELQMKTEIWGAVGDDKCGQFYLKTLRRQGVDVSRVKLDNRFHTSRTIVLEGEGEKRERSFIHIIGANLRLSVEHYQSSDQTWGDYLGYPYIFGRWPSSVGDIKEIISRMKERGKAAMLALSADPKREWVAVRPLLEKVDILFLNREEAQGVTQQSPPNPVSPQEYLNHLKGVGERLHDYGVRLMSMTLGSDGAFLFRRTQNKTDFALIPVFDVPLKKRRAAGDAFAAGVMAYLEKVPEGQTRSDALASADLAEMGKYGSVVASLAVSGDKASPQRIGELIAAGKVTRSPNLIYTV